MKFTAFRLSLAVVVLNLLRMGAVAADTVDLKVGDAAPKFAVKDDSGKDWKSEEVALPGLGVAGVAGASDEDDVFYVLAGTMSVMVGTEWNEATAGSFVLVPGNVVHDFQNRGSERAGMLNVSAPGNFEEAMPGIAQWFRERSPDDARV